MRIIKAKFLKDGVAIGRPYTYFANEEAQVGDVIYVPSPNGKSENPKAIVVETDVAEEEIKDFKDRVKTIIGLIPTGKGEASGENS